MGAELLWGLGFGLLSAVWPLYLTDLGARPQEIGLVFGAGNLVAVLCFLPAGYLADRVGRKAVLLAAYVTSTLGVWSFVPLGDWHGAFLGSALYWSGSASLPLMFALIAAAVPRAQLGSAMGLLLGAYFAGNIAGAPLAGPIAATFGLRAAVAAAAVLLTVSTALILGLRATPPIPERGAFRPPRSFWTLLAVAPFGAALSILSLALLPVYLRDIAAVPLERIGFYLGLISLGATLLAVAMGRLADALGTVPALIAAACVLTSAALLVAFSGRNEPIIAVAALLLGATQAPNPVLAAAVERIIPPARAALGYATYQVAFAIGFGSGGTVAGFLYEADPLLPFIVTAALALPVAATIGVVLTRTAARATLTCELT